jgi:Mn-containing catalase
MSPNLCLCTILRFTADPRFGNMLLEQFGGTNGELDVDQGSNIAAEAQGQKLCTRGLLNLGDDSGTKDALQF